MFEAPAVCEAVGSLESVPSVGLDKWINTMTCVHPMGFPGGLVGKESACKAGDLG